MKVILGVAIAMLAVVTPVVVTPFVVATAADAATPACSATSGVTVIVDFTHFAGGKVERGCAPGHPANGLIALHAAGFATAGTAQYGDAFVCRIDGLPTPKQDACAVTPPPSAFWAYWYARPADSQWTYSALGVLDYHPQPGTIEAFAFGNHAQPGVPPSAAMPTTTTTTTRTPTTAAPVTTPLAPVTAATFPSATTTDPGVGALRSTTTTTKHRTPKTTSTSTSTTTASPRSTATTSTSVAIVERSASGPASHSSSGSPVGAILAIVIVGGLALGAFAFTRARRHRLS
jgi:hypothetical protein